ncbi:hypothetical protein V6Z12_D11G295200 [Gossypium hirsutum]
MEVPNVFRVCCCGLLAERRTSSISCENIKTQITITTTTTIRRRRRCKVRRSGNSVSTSRSIRSRPRNSPSDKLASRFSLRSDQRSSRRCRFLLFPIFLLYITPSIARTSSATSPTHRHPLSRLPPNPTRWQPPLAPETPP